MIDHYINVGNGTRWYLGDQSRNTISIEEVAHSLASMPRFNGHIRLVDGYVYNVAQHSIKVAWLTGSLNGLMHDSSETITGDPSTPQKAYLRQFTDAFDVFEASVAKRFAELFSTSYPLPPGVKTADCIMLLIEARYLFPDGGRDLWLAPKHRKVVSFIDLLLERRPELKPHGWSPTHSAAKFIDEFRTLGGISPPGRCLECGAYNGTHFRECSAEYDRYLA